MNKLEKEREAHLNTDPLILIECINNSIQILLSNKQIDEGQNCENSGITNNLLQSEYEEMIKKLEEEIKNHLSLEHQLNLELNKGQEKISELENTKQYMNCLIDVN